MYLVVGLGNPGNRYRNTRHNLGFMVLDRLAKRYHKRFYRGPGPYFLSGIRIETEHVFLAKPVTYMNESGIAVKDLITRKRVDFDKLLVICDDVNLPVGKIRLRRKGSDGGQRGLISIINTLHSQAFPRLRMGIGHRPETDRVAFVLSPFSASELPVVQEMIERSVTLVEDLVLHGIETAMNTFNC